MAQTQYMEVHDPQSRQVRAIREVIRSTSRTLEEIQKTFHGQRTSLVVEEESELKKRLEDLMRREKQLTGWESGDSAEFASGSSPDFSNQSPQESVSPKSPLTISHSCPISPPPPPPPSSLPLIVNDNDVSLIPSSPLPHNCLIRAHLPEGQRTIIPVRQGYTILEALDKAMKTRNLTPGTCTVYTDKPRLLVDWNTDTSFLNGKEVFVEYVDKATLASTNHHSFVRKTFITLAFCDVCKKLLFQGFRCETCGFRYHQRCSPKVPIQCGGVDDDLIMAYILSQQQRSNNSPQPSSPHSPTVPQSFRVPIKCDEELSVGIGVVRKMLSSTRERSISTPNVLYTSGTRDRSSSEDSHHSRSQSPMHGNILIPPVYIDTHPSNESMRINQLQSLGDNSVFDFSSTTSPISNQQIKVISGRGTHSGPIETPHHGLDAMRIDRRRRGHRRQSSAGSVEYVHQMMEERDRRNSMEGKPPSDKRSHDHKHTGRHRSLERRSSSGDRTSTDSPSTQSPLQTPTTKAPLQTSLSSNDSGVGSSRPSVTSYHSSTLPSQRRRQRLSSEDKRTKLRHRDSSDVWEIPYNEMEVGERIGSGSFGTVYKGRWHGPVAVKKLNVSNPTEQQMQAFKNEVAVLMKTRHANILLFMGWTSKPQLTIVTQWCDGSTLFRHIHVMEIKFEMYKIIDICRQTAQGMDYLHAKQIIHRDLKSNNIFLHDDLTVKIGDFGLATVKTLWDGNEKVRQPTGSILWMAPEVVRMEESDPYSFYCDVYSFGVVIYELITGQLPYPHVQERDQILFMVGCGFLRPDPSIARKDTPKTFKQLCIKCCQFKKDDRPLFHQILADLESLADSMPKIKRSSSEPSTLHYIGQMSIDDQLPVTTQHTPSHPKHGGSANETTFTFFPVPNNGSDK